MRIRIQHLSAHLRDHGSSPFYCFFGEEPLLIQEARETLYEHFKSNAYERSRYTISKLSDWQEVRIKYYERTLFSDKTLLDCEIGNGKIGKDGANVLRSIIENPSESSTLLLIADKLDTAVLNSAWFKQLDKSGVILQLFKIPKVDYPQWLKQSLSKKGFSIAPDALSHLADLVQGNLLAAKQAVEKLSLFTQNTCLTFQDVNEHIATSRQYALFELADKIISRESEDIFQCLNQLRNEKIDPTLINWSLSKQIRECFQMSLQIQQGHTIEEVFSTFRVWHSKKSFLKKILMTTTPNHWICCLHQSQSIDCIIKGLNSGDIWDSLLDLAYYISAKP